jgi:NAD(P)-dependent dehydrogenase (short-subunit alcohol dehydrogenase family)
VHDPLDFTGKVVLVTGGTKGVGRGVVTAFVAAGATVATCARNQPDEPLTGVDMIAADIRDPDECRRVVTAVAERHGRLDVLVNNAGGSPAADSASASPRFSESIIRLNLLAPLWLSQAAHGFMTSNEEGGAIVNVASMSGLRPSPNTVAYGAAKAGLLNLTQTLALEWAPKIRVNAVSPGYVLTEQAPLFYGDEESVTRVAAIVPLGRLAEPSDVAGACLFAASPLCPYMSGANIVVHGGGEAPGYLAARSS